MKVHMGIGAYVAVPTSMKILAPLALAALFAATGCATSTSGEDSGSSADDMRAQTFSDVSDGARMAVDLLETKPQSSMTIAASKNVKAWRFDMSAKGFVVTSIDDQGRENLSTAFAISVADGKAMLAGIAVSHPYVSVEQIREVMQQIKDDLDAAQANIPEVQDPGVPSDPGAWSPQKPARCDSEIQSFISITMSTGILLAFGGLAASSSVVGSPAGVFAIGAGVVLVGVGAVTDELFCDRGEVF
jgi:hypothetical protein